jgi:hypothetical protein
MAGKWPLLEPLVLKRMPGREWSVEVLLSGYTGVSGNMWKARETRRGPLNHKVVSTLRWHEAGRAGVLFWLAPSCACHIPQAYCIMHFVDQANYDCLKRLQENPKYGN